MQFKAMRRQAWPAVVAVVTLALAGCGGGGGSPGPVELAVTVTGDASAPSAGPGRVTSQPAGLDCNRGTCRASFAAGTVVTLTASAGSGQRFTGWTGACSGTAAACTLTMSEARSAGATFATTPVPVQHALTVSVAGSGAVTSEPAGIACGTNCAANFAAGTAVTLTAAPATGQVLQVWGGACAGTSGLRCIITMDQARSVTATFVAQPVSRFTLSLSVTGSGHVASQPAGIDCGNTCSAEFDSTATVVLTATPAQGQRLQAWGGACTGNAATCNLPMSQARSATATFEAIPQPAPAWGVAALLESSNDFNVTGTNIFADTNVLTAIDAAGNALVIWQQSDGIPDGNTEKVYSRRYVAGQGWAPAVTVPGITGSSSFNAVTGRLVMDASGVATWIRHNFETRRYSAAGGWSATAIALPASGGGSLADAKVGADGAVHILGIGGDVLYSRLPAGGTQWTAWAMVSQGNQAARHTQLALGPQGSAVAVWSERNPGDANHSMKANRMVGGTWQTPVRIEELLTDVIDTTPRVASDASGNALAVWQQATSLYASRYDAAAGTWGAPTEIDAGQLDTTFRARIQLAMAPDGRSVLAWSAGLAALRAASYAPGTGFSAPAAVNSYQSGYFLGIDDEGRAVVVYRAVSQWPNPTDATQNLYARELSAGGSTWSTAALLETGAGDVKGNAPCAMNAAGQTVCTWAQDDLPNNTVRNSLWANLRR